MERRQILTGVIVRIGKLRHAEIIRSGLLAFVDAGIEIDKVPAGLSGCLHDDFDVALAVEGAYIATRRIARPQAQDYVTRQLQQGIALGGMRFRVTSQCSNRELPMSPTGQ